MKRRILDFMMTVCCMVFSFLALVACDNELDIRQEYPFTVESMPVADEIVNGETVEIRLEIKPEGNFSGTVYTLRYFQPDGSEICSMEEVLQVAAEGHQDLPEDLEVKALNQKVLISRQVSL